MGIKRIDDAAMNVLAHTLAETIVKYVESEGQELSSRRLDELAKVVVKPMADRAAVVRSQKD